MKLWISLVVIAGCTVVGRGCEQPEAQKAAAAQALEAIKNADELLTALETADADLKSLTADVKYDKIDGIAGDRQVRQGKVFFEDRGASGGDAGARDRKFSVRFDKLQLGDRVEEETKLFVFDGRWLIEVAPKFKQVIKREVVPAGESFDPLKIGEGPLPLPIGQKKADIARRFYAELLPETAGLAGENEQDTAKLQGFVKGSYQLRLVPKPNTDEAEKFKEVRLWYREGGVDEGGRRLLPRMVRTVTPNDTVSIVQMINVKTNQPIDPAMMAAVEPGADWNVHVEALPASKK